MSKSSFASLLSSFKSAPKQTGTASSVESKSIQSVATTAPTFAKSWSRVQEFLSDYRDNPLGDQEHSSSSDTKEIALLFIIQKDLPNELLWRLWIERVESSNCRIRVWIHAKEPSAITSRWIQDRLVRRFQLRPSWGSLELTKTMVCLLFEVCMIVSPSFALNSTVTRTLLCRRTSTIQPLICSSSPQNLAFLFVLPTKSFKHYFLPHHPHRERGQGRELCV